MGINPITVATEVMRIDRGRMWQALITAPRTSEPSLIKRWAHSTIKKPFDIAMAASITTPIKDITFRVVASRWRTGYGRPACAPPAITNILHNAAQHFPEDTTIVVSTSLLDNGVAGQSSVQFDVVDSGPGIPKEEQLKIFDLFYRVDKARFQKDGGAGLGLAISKWAVEVNGEHIGVENADDRNCRFFV
jgi:hypothetical protein